MKIVFLSRLSLPHIGGVELHIQHLIENLPSHYSFVLISEQHDQTLPLHEIVGRVETYRVPIQKGQSKKIAIWGWIFAHLSLFFAADIIHIHDVFFWIIPFRILFIGKKLFMTFHGYEGNNSPTWRQKFWHQLAATLTQGNLCIGGFHAKWYGVRPTDTSFGAVDQQFLIGKEKRKKRTDRKEFLYVGRLSADTGILSYLQAFIELKIPSHSWHLDVFGDGPDFKEAQEMVRRYALPVHFHGFVDPSTIEWKNYDVALVSRYLSILEALASGLPVIAESNVAIKTDYLTLSPFAQWITIAPSVARLQEALHSVFEEKPKKPETQVVAKKWAQEQTWAQMAEQYERLWQKKSQQR